MPEQPMNEILPGGGMPAEQIPNTTAPTEPLAPTAPTPGAVPPIAPASDEAMPAGPMSQEQVPPMDEQAMKQDIERQLADVGNQNNALESKKIISANKLKNFKIEILKKIYSMLQDLGVDASDPNSIKEFLLSLEQQNPDLLTLFETIFDTLSPDEQVGITPEAGETGEQLEEPTGPNLLDKYSNLQEQVLR